MRRHSFTLMICALFALSGLFLHASFAAPPSDALPDAALPGGLSTSPSGPTVVVVLPDPEKDPGGFAAQLYQAYQSRDYRALLAGAGIVIVWTLRKLSKHLRSDRAGAATALGIGVAGAFVAALAAGKPMDGGLIFDGVMMGLTSAGGWVVIRRLFAPKDLEPGAAS